MQSRRHYLKTVASGVTALSVFSTGSAAASSQDEMTFQDELQNREFTQYESKNLNEEGTTPDDEGTYKTRVYEKTPLMNDIREKSGGEVTRPGAVFFEQELSGDWEGSWNIDASLGEVSSETQYVFNTTNNIDFSLINLKLSLGNPKVHTDYTKKTTTIENQTVTGKTGSESLVPSRAIGHIVSTFESLLLQMKCSQYRYAAGLWRNMIAGEKQGKTIVARDDEIDYSKAGYSMAHRTYNAEWTDAEGHWGERIDDDPFNTHVNIRGYLSIESRGGERYLAVGGFYINEDEVEFDQFPLDETLEVNSDELQTDILQLMRSRELN